MLFFKVIRAIMPQTDNHNIPCINVIHQILVPETAILLAQANMGLSHWEAVGILKTSKEYGIAFYPQDESTDTDAFIHDLKRRWTGDKAAKLKCKDNIVDLMKEEPVEAELLCLTEADVEYQVENNGEWDIIIIDWTQLCSFLKYKY